MMKKILLALCSLPTFCFAQTFTNSSPIIIHDTAVNIMQITVSGLPTVMDSSFGITSICFDITHTYTGDLRIELISPSGETITLADSKGGGDDNYTATCFQEDALNGWIQDASSPFTGSFFPQNSLNLFNDGQNPNGIWQLKVSDLFAADTGSVNYCSISFGANPPADPVNQGGPCTSANPTGCQCPTPTSTDCDLLPDMTASALIIQNTHTEFPGHITLANATPNIGYGPMEIHGISSCFCDSVPVPCSVTSCPSGSPVTQLVEQTIYHRLNNSMTSYNRPAGTMSYHANHGHTHVDTWASFTLRRPTPDPDARNWPIIGTGNKVSFCLINLGDCSSNLGYCIGDNGNVWSKDSIPNSDFGTVSGCGIDQGIYVGNLDIYNESHNGMGVVFPSTTCNGVVGDYYIVSITDPDNIFLEQNEDNNWVAVPVTLTQQQAGTFASAGFTYTLNNNIISTVANEANPDSVVWNWGDGTSSVTTTASAQHTYSAVGTYIVWSYTYNMCGPSVDADTIFITGVGVNNVEQSLASFKAYPNPAQGNMSLVYTLINASDVKIELFDITGRVVRTLVAENQLAGKYKVGVNKNSLGLSSQNYFARITTGRSTKTIKLTFTE